MKNYDKIFNIVDNLSNKINIALRLITFDNDKLKKLKLMDKRLRLFYFFRVYEIISLIVDNVDNASITTNVSDEFWQLLKKLGDLDDYNQLFISEIKLNWLCKLIELIKNIPRDLVKLIIDYCQPSIYICEDLDLISDRIILSNF
jgi:hypothetical protein